jgi:hypothetical protein
VVWLYLLNRDTAYWSFVLNVLDKTAEGPDVIEFRRSVRTEERTGGGRADSIV